MAGWGSVDRYDGGELTDGALMRENREVCVRGCVGVKATTSLVERALCFGWELCRYFLLLSQVGTFVMSNQCDAMRLGRR